MMLTVLRCLFLTVFLPCFALAMQPNRCADRMTVVGLIQPYWVHYDYRALDGRRQIYYYVNAHGNPFAMHPRLGPKSNFVNLIASPRPIPQWAQVHIRRILDRLSTVINLQFIRVYNKSSSDFTINAVCDAHTVVAGLTDGIAQHSDQYNVIVNLAELGGCALPNFGYRQRKRGTLLSDPSDRMLQSVFLHELGHVMGLEHPFDDSDGDCIYSTQAWGSDSATKRDTLMAYIFEHPIDIWYRPYDIKALKQIWGEADQ